MQKRSCAAAPTGPCQTRYFKVEPLPVFCIHHQEAVGQNVLGYLSKGRRRQAGMQRLEVGALGRAKPALQELPP